MDAVAADGRNRWTPEFLDSMRLVADPEADALIREVEEKHGFDAVMKLRPFFDNWDAPVTDDLPACIREFFLTPVEYPSWVDFDKIRIAEDLFVSYGPVSTVVLLLNAVPRFFTNPAGARSFYMAKIFGPDSVRNRIMEVPKFVINITRHGGLAQMRDPATGAVQKGIGMITVQKLRMAHARIRCLFRMDPKDEGVWDYKKLGQPINQEDLAEAVMHFCLSTVEGLVKVGIDQTPEQEEGTLMAWKTVAFLLGLREDLQPVGVPEATWLRDTIMQRHSQPTMEGKALIVEMLDIVDDFLPFFLRSFPAGLMRYQLGDRIADMLAVPNPKLLLFLLTILKPVWEKDKVFAKLAMKISPHVVNWLVNTPPSRNQAQFVLPPRLAATWGVKQ
ncbi:MAG: oxygenase MpaB family protein [Acidobacteriota bacterium]